MGKCIFWHREDSRRCGNCNDSRRWQMNLPMQRRFVFAANGIKNICVQELCARFRNFHLLSVYLKCIAGIVITASHNPREYNGYKVYWEDGAQVTPPHDTGIMAEVAKVTSFDMVKTMEKEKAQAEGLYQDFMSCFYNSIKGRVILFEHTHKLFTLTVFLRIQAEQWMNLP